MANPASKESTGNRFQAPDSPLVTADWLANHLDKPWIRVIDARWSLADPEGGRVAYTKGHIPGAVFLDLETELTGPDGPGRHPLPEPDRLANRLGELGIGNEHFVVVYDEASGAAAAARCWWLLRHFGHRHTAVLDGGLAAWRSQGGALEDADAEWSPTDFHIELRRDDVIDRDALLASLESATLVDARDPERYSGESEPIDPIGGHILGALNAPYALNTTTEGRFKPRDEIRRLYTRLGVDTASDLVVYCGSGVTACHTLLALEYAGIDQARLYPGSWSDWSAYGRPMATGSEPGA